MITDLLDITKQFQTESRKLKAWEMKLIEMRNEGRPYHEIRDILKANFPKAKTGFAETYLRTCLMNGGRLFNAFSAYNEMTAMESMSEGIQARRNAHNLAVSTTIALLSKSINRK